MIWSQCSLYLASLMFRMLITPPWPSDAAEGAWTPPGATRPWLNRPWA